MFLETLINKTSKSIFNYEQALSYLHSRYVTDDEIRLFKIGFSRIISLADDGTEDFKDFSKKSYKGRKLENKIIFPILDMIGKPVGCITRSIEIKEYELYLTTEGKDLGAMFGLYQALPDVYQTGRAYIVEGPFDLFAFRKVYTNTASTNTAELTEAQHEQLSFYADRIIAVFDSDPPGRAATARAEERFGIESINLGYKDPSNCMAQCGSFKNFAERVKKVVNEKISPD
jgi:DNA primase